MNPSVNFERQPRKAYRFKYLSEDRRPEVQAEKIVGNNETIHPQITLVDPSRRKATLKLTCVSSNQIKDKGYCVHPNKIHLLDDDGASTQQFVINYELNECNYDAENRIIIDFKRIWIEHVRVKCKKVETNNAQTPLKRKRKRKTEANVEKINFIENNNAQTPLKRKRKTEANVEKINFIENNIKSCIQILDPFQLGYDKKRKINFDELRLCCVVEFEDGTKLPPIVSNIIKNTEVEVVDVVYNNGKARGGHELCILVKNLKVKSDEEVIVRFFDVETGWTVDQALSRNHCNNALFVIVPPYDTPYPLINSKNVTFFLCKKLKNKIERIDQTDHIFTYTPDSRAQNEDEDDDDGITETIQIGLNQREALQQRYQQTVSDNGNTISESDSLKSARVVEQGIPQVSQDNTDLLNIDDGCRISNGLIDSQINDNTLSINNDYENNELFEWDDVLNIVSQEDISKQVQSPNEEEKEKFYFFEEKTEDFCDMMDISIDDKSSDDQVESLDINGNFDATGSTNTLPDSQADHVLSISNDSLSSSPEKWNVLNFFNKIFSECTLA